MRLCRVFKSSSGPDIFAFGDISLCLSTEQYRRPGVNFWLNLSTCQFAKGGAERRSLFGERKPRLRTWCDRSELIRGCRRDLSINKPYLRPKCPSFFCPPPLLEGIPNSITTGLYTSLWPRDSKTLRRGGRVYSRSATKYLS